MTVNWFKEIIDLILWYILPKPVINEKGLALIKKCEGLRLAPYRDVNGAMKIGYGSPWDGNLPTISSMDAENLLLETLKPMEHAVFRAIKVPITPDQYSAVLSLVYNIGVTEFLKSHLLMLLNQGLYLPAGNEFLRWDHIKGVVNHDLTERRIAERDLFLSSPTPPPLN